MNAAPRIAVVVPVHNEEANLPELLRRLRAALDALEGGPHQMVLVDDGSSDSTWAILEREASRDPRVTALGLSRNFGHQAALTAGLDYASGDAVVVMDGDLQDPPEAITGFVARFREGYDVVYAQRVRRKERWWLRLCYFAFYRMMAQLSDIHLPVDAGDFGLMSRRVADLLRQMREHHRYLRGLRSWAGFRQTGIAVERGERYSGRSQYGMLGLLRLATDAIFAFSIVPIRAAALLGAAGVGLSILYTIYAIGARLFLHRSPQGFTALVLLITFLSGTLLLFLGVIGEYVGRIYEEAKGRPLYVVSRKAGRGGPEACPDSIAVSDSRSRGPAAVDPRE
ncbi:MAG TPA: glycosyltransferase family 2 protein [Candidatus Acidoferrales bacterium]|nr:glycosyltransferase family 2 protein [Candidatus Acidoferrales bacterium]